MPIHFSHARAGAQASVLRGLLMSITLLLGAFSVQAATVYHVSDDFGTASLSGTITTDGTIGAVSNGNITDWNIVLVSGTTSTSLTKGPLNSELFSDNGNLIASATELSFDHAVNQIFLIRDFPIQNFWCLEGPNNGCFGNPSSSNVSVGGRFNQHINPNRTGLHVYGAVAAVPLPAGVVLFLTGLLGAAALKRGKNRAGQI